MPTESSKFTAWGDPTRAAAFAPTPSPPGHAPAAAPPPPSRRLGVPTAAPLESETLSDRQSLLLRREREDEIEADIADSLQLDQQSPGLLAQALRQPGVVTVLVALSALVLLFASTQVLTFVNQLSTLPAWARPLGYAGVTLLAGAVVLAVARLVFLYARLRTSPRINLRAIQALKEREELRDISLARLGNARAKLSTLLRAYPLTTKSDDTRLLALGLQPDELTHLRNTRRRLLEEERGSDDAWLDQFNRQFLTTLDAAARRRVTRYAKIVFLKTTVLPRGSLDTLAVLFNAYRMTADLCRLYNVRAGRWDTAAILARIVTNALLASRLDEWTGSLADYTTDALTSHAHDLAANVAIKATGKAAAGLTDGAANALLMSRLGRATVRYLRPLREVA